MKNKDGISDDDRDLFRDAVGEIKRVQHDRVNLEPSPRPPQRRKRLHEEIHRADIGHDSHAGDAFSDHFQSAASEGGSEAADELSFARPGVQRKTLRQLKRGQLPCGMELDLHGMTVAEARPILAEFIADSRQRRLRSVRIIHGKGYRSAGFQPVLKGMVNNWLRQHDGVLAFYSARQADGGTGAVNVLLKG
jgi:DNA-nicking Smr family endonuclease